jgi:hypothetical protein
VSVEEAAVDPGASDAGGADLGAVGGTRFASSKVAATLGLWESFISRMGLILGGVTSPADAIPDLERLMRDVLRSVSPIRKNQFIEITEELVILVDFVRPELPE